MILLLQITVSEKDQFCFWSCVCDKDIFMERGIITLLFLTIESGSLMSTKAFKLFLIPGLQWRAIISNKQRSPKFLAQQEGTLIVSAFGGVLVF